MPSTGYLARLAMRLTLLDLPSRMPRLQIVTRFDLNGRGTGQSETVPKGVPRRLDENKKTTTISRYRGRSSMAERQLPKLHTRVRFPSPAPKLSSTRADSFTGSFTDVCIPLVLFL